MTIRLVFLLGAILMYRTDLSAAEPIPPDQLLLKDYRPRSIFKSQQTRPEKARHTAIDAHSHAYARSDAEVDQWVKVMDEVGVEKTIILSGATGKRFDEIMARYGRHPKRFDVWCGIDYGGFDRPGFGPAAIAELERCRKAGAAGVGEMSDKGRGLNGSTNIAGMHMDDPRMDAILERCGSLGMPINIHVGEDQWMYEPMDQHNDGLMNAWKWRIPEDPAVLRHDEVVDTLDRAVAKHPGTVFIACHFANCCADLNRLGRMLDKYPNLHADISARFAEISPIPRTAGRFFARYADRLLYGTDMGIDAGMFRDTFRILETDDEHFYTTAFAKYHWPAHGMALPDDVLRKVYRDNAVKLFGKPAGR